ncbi:MAG: GtrA family protein [Candidatus Microgenomates bacterium]|jgi:putative flippase GtrA
MCGLTVVEVLEEEFLNNSLIRKVLNFIRLRFVGFSLVGGAVFVMGIGILTFQVQVLHINKILAGFINMVISVEVNFLLNKYINWRDRIGSFGSQWLKFHASRAVTITINQILYTVFVSMGFNYLLVNIVLTLLVTVTNFFGSDKFAFAPKKGGGDGSET